MQLSETPGRRTAAQLRRWHALTQEPVLEPELQIIDPHHHLWDRPTDRYALEELLVDVCSGHDVRATCFVECTSMYRADGPDHLRPVGETEWVNRMAAQSASGLHGPARVCSAIVGHADLRSERLDEVLASHVAAGAGRFRGIRQQAQHDPVLGSMAKRPTVRGLLADPAFRRGLSRLGRSGLSFDAWIYFTQLEELADAARACPGTVIVLNHLGGPIAIGPYRANSAENFARWRSGMAALAELKNVVVKVGGLGMTSYGFGFEHDHVPASSERLAAAWRPHVETTITLFGADRCMFESNFPVDAQSCNYVPLWNAFKRLTRDASQAERAELFAGTARRVYGIEKCTDEAHDV